jgi:hypothetical protein
MTMRAKLAVAAAVLFFTGAAHADSVYSVSIAPTAMEDGDVASLSFNWDASTQVITDIDLSVTSVEPSSHFTWSTETAGFVSGGLYLLELDGPGGSYFQIDMQNYDLPPLAPIVGQQTIAWDLNCPPGSGCSVSFGDIEFGAAIATITDPPPVSTPEPSSLLLAGLGIIALIGFRRPR